MTATLSRLRARMLLGCGLAALAAAGLEEKAAAQAFNATPGVVAGSVVIDRTPGLDTITISSPSAIIDWRLTVSPPVPDPIVFLPAGNTGIFQSAPGGGEFAVLNRILPVGSSRIRMDGNVIGRLQTAAGNVPGGTVVFYSPNGLVIGSSAVFDVGRLLLTTLNPAVDASGNFFTAGTFQLNGGQFPPASIVTEAGARFNAPAEGSWIAMAAPRIDHGGIVRVNGSAAYVAAGAVSLRIDQGLFDIDIQVGTGDANPIVHRGATGGPASAGAGDNHVVYLAAAPQNNPITLLLAGSAGFDSAVSASVENGAIVLSSGHDVQGLAISETPQGSPSGDVLIRSGTYTSDVFGRASQDFIVGDTAAGGVVFEQDLSIAARRSAQLVADGDYVLRIGGSASVSAANLRPVPPDLVTIDIAGGDAAILAGSGGTIAIGGNAIVDASARGGSGGGGSVGSGSGGRAFVRSEGGTLTVAGNLAVRSDGFGGLDPLGQPGDSGGAGNGGGADLAATNRGTISIGGSADVRANGIASAASGTSSAAGANGTGGSASVSATEGGAIAIGGLTTVAATGTGGATPNAAGTGGTGSGGNATLLAAGGTLDVTGGASLVADGAGASGGSGGAGTGGTARIDAAVGRVTSAGTLSVRASGTGGKASAAAGGDGTGGFAGILALAGISDGVVGAGAMSLDASGTGGSAFAARGGDGQGGTVEATADARNGRLGSGAFSAQSNGTGGEGGSARGGDGSAGTVLAGTVAPPIGDATVPGGYNGRAEFGASSLSASGTGGAGAAGGTGAGGDVTLVSTSAPTAINGTATLAANGIGGLGGSGARGLAQGGDILVTAAGADEALPDGGGVLLPLDVGPPGSLSAPTLAAQADALGDGSNLNAMGRWRFVSADGSAINLGTADVGAASTGTPTPRTSELRLTGGTLNVSGSGTFATDGRIGLAASGTGRLVGGDIALSGRAGIALTHGGRAAGAQTVDADRFTATTPNAYDAQSGTAVLGRIAVTIGAGTQAALAQTASNGVTEVNAGTLARFIGAATGREVRVTSSDVDVTSAGSIGNTATDLVALQVRPNAGATTLGGAGAVSGGGYTVTQGEANRIRGDVVRLTALPGASAVPASAQILVRDLTLAGSTAAAGINRFEVSTPGTVRIEGALLLAGAAAGDAIGLSAERVEVVTDGGSLRVRDGAGAPAGSVDIAAGDIWVADAATLTRLAADPNFAGRDETLRTNDGADRPRGQVEADAVRIAPARTLYVRNSGTAAAFAAITVGPGGLVVDPGGNAPASVYAFGRRLNTDGSFSTNFTFFGEVDFRRDSSAGYTDEAEFNRCVINQPFCGGPFVPPPDYPQNLFRVPPLQPPGDPLEPLDFLAEPLIEEPVTSGSDPTLWTGPGDEDEEEEEQRP
ncbi:MAG TPA: hypothetical protein VF552_00925 [Allosphingosinicella sp.]